jgi:chromosome condensin MukBEF MukE localization factor
MLHLQPSPNKRTGHNGLTSETPIYTLGLGTAANEKLAKFYSDKATGQKRDWERQQDRQDRAANNMLTGFVVGTILGAALF